MSLFGMRNEVSELKTVVRELYQEVKSLKNEVGTLSRRVSPLPEPLRENWIHTAGPEPLAMEDRETQIIPIAALVERRNSKKLPAPPALSAPPACPIHRVVICIYGEMQYILALDANSKKLEYYSGWARSERNGKTQMTLTLAAFGDHEWEIAKVGSPEWNSIYEAMSA